MAENETATADIEVLATSTDGLGDKGLAALKAEREAAKAEREARKLAETASAELAAKLKEYEDRDKSETQRLADSLAAAEARATAAEARASEHETERDRLILAAAVAEEKKLPVGVLRGSTREELETHADSILAITKSSVNVVPSAGSGGESTTGGGLAAGRELARKK